MRVYIYIYVYVHIIYTQIERRRCLHPTALVPVLLLHEELHTDNRAPCRENGMSLSAPQS